MYKVHCLNNISKKGLATFSSDYEVVDSIDGADVLLVRSANMQEMEIPDSVKCVARAGAGVNNIPLEKLAERGIPVFNTPGANANAVKELVVAGMLLACRDLIGGNEWVRENADDENVAKSAEKAKKAFAGCELEGKTLGIVGLGAIGKKVAKVADGLGMECIGTDPFLTQDDISGVSACLRFEPNASILYQMSDFITIHVPATKDTVGMIDSSVLSMMRNGVVFLNFSRDTLVNDDDMAKALESGKVGKYVTDFANPKVVKMPNTIVLPHLGASTQEAEDNCAKMAAEEVMKFLETGEKVHCVNL